MTVINTKLYQKRRDPSRVSNRNLKYNVPYTLVALNKMYMYTLFLNAKCTKMYANKGSYTRKHEK